MPRFTEILEHPVPENPDWYLRKVKHANPIGTDEFQWTVQLMHRPTGAPIEFTHTDLYIAWVRAVEGARNHDSGLFHEEGEDAGQSLS